MRARRLPRAKLLALMLVATVFEACGNSAAPKGSGDNGGGPGRDGGADALGDRGQSNTGGVGGASGTGGATGGGGATGAGGEAASLGRCHDCQVRTQVCACDTNCIDCLFRAGGTAGCNAVLSYYQQACSCLLQKCPQDCPLSCNF
ncbi:MAG: hypothetical protein ABJA82_03470 [Myxococcales bacterium]